jgi:hypothetical protein
MLSIFDINGQPAIRDLFALDVDVATLLPGDETADARAGPRL